MLYWTSLRKAETYNIIYIWGSRGIYILDPRSSFMGVVAINSAIFEIIVSLIFKPGEMWKLFCDNMIDVIKLEKLELEFSDLLESG